jgi:hypothetical protein
VKPITYALAGLILGIAIGSLISRRSPSIAPNKTASSILDASRSPGNSGTHSERLNALLAEDDQVKLHQYAQQVPPSSFEEALDTIRVSMRRLTPPEEVAAFKAILIRYAASSPEEALAYVKSLKLPDIKIHGFDAVLTGWAEANLDAATAFITDPTSDAAISGSRFRGAAIRAVAEVVGRQDYQKAIDWALALPESMSKTAHREITRMMVLSEPALAADFVEKAPLKDRDWLSGKVAWEWGKRDPQASLAWVEGFSAPEYQDKHIRHVIAGWAETAPLDAGRYLAERSSVDDEMIKTLVREWSYHDTPSAAAWAISSPGALRGHAVDELMKQWTDTQPEEASNWLANQQDGSVKDRGIVSLARTISSTDLGAAVGWVVSISDPTTRRQQLLRYAPRWAAKDRSATSEWVRSTTLSEDVRQVMEVVLGQSSD